MTSHPWSDERSDVPRGHTETHRFTSSILKNDRDIEIYTPPDYSTAGKPYPVLIVFDQGAYTTGARVPTPTILDNLIADRRIGPMMAVLVSNASGQRGAELPCNVKFADFLRTELMPWVRRGYNATAEAADTYTAGSSFGALAATCAALFHPDLVGNVISQSGSYWWEPGLLENRQRDPSFEPVAPATGNWVAREFASRPKLPIRFWLDAGLFEVDLSGGSGGILLPTRHFRDVLVAKGYEVHYDEFTGGHDYLSWRGTLADGLIALAGSAP